MKKSFLWMALFLWTAVLQQCTTDDSENASPQKIQFTFSYKSSNAAGGRVQQGAVPDALLLSLNGAEGDPVFTSKRIALLHVGESYITEPIEMTPGTYSITGFMLVAGDSVLYLTPFEGSPLSRIVNHPLPVPLVVNKNLSTTIDMQVIPVGMNPPEDFGYASFTINALNPFQISVFTETTNLTDAIAYILEDWDTVAVQHLDARINILSFPGGDPNARHKLIVNKPGYAAFIKPFHYDELVASLHGLPLKVMLEPALFTILPASNTFSMQLRGMPGTLNIEWGDGTQELFTLNPDSFKLATHTFDNCCRPINVTGDLDKIRYLSTGTSDFYDINVQGLSRLGWVNISGIQGPSAVDFSHNANLYFIFMNAVARLKQITLPPACIFDIYYLDISGSDQFTTASIDNLIEQVYVQANPNISGASFFLNSFAGGFIGPPSQAGMDKLRELRDVYHWTITPNPN